MPLSLIMKKCVPCALSGLPAVRPAMVRLGLAMIGLCVARILERAGRAWSARCSRSWRSASPPRAPTAARAACSRLCSSSLPASTVLPRLTRWVRRCQIVSISGRLSSASRPAMAGPVWRLGS